MKKGAKVFISMFIMAMAFALCPSFLTSASNTVVWHLSDLSYSNSKTFNSNYYAQITFSFTKDYSTFSVEDYMDMNGSLTISYDPFTISNKVVGTLPSNGGTYTYNYSDSYYSGLKPFLKDNKNRYYELDAVNGGTIDIEDCSDITFFVFQVSGTTGSYSSSPRYLTKAVLTQTVSDFDIRFSTGSQLATITDSEGTVWTVPDGVENPVVIREGTSTWNKYLLDGVNGLCYFVNPLDSAKKVLGAEEYIDVVLYDYDLHTHNALLNVEYAGELGIEPVFCTHMWQFTEFLYGSLPELTVVPLTPDPPDPPVPPDPDDLVNLGDVKIGVSDTGDVVKEGTVYVPSGVLIYETKRADFISNSVNTENPYIRHAVIEDYCPKFIGRFTLDVDTDGYVSMQFPDLFIFPEMIKPEEYVPLNADKVVFPTESGLPEIGLLSEWAEPIVVLYADGKKYYVSPYGGNVRIPVNVGENVVIMEIGLQVKDEFLANHDGYINAVYQCYFQDFAVYIREYKEQSASDIEQIKDMLGSQLEESQKQTDALTNFDGKSDMDTAKSDMDAAKGEYDSVESNLFTVAGSSIEALDLSDSLTMSQGALAGIQIISGFMVSIISSLGEFSSLYTFGFVLVIVVILFGLAKHSSGDKGG